MEMLYETNQRLLKKFYVIDSLKNKDENFGWQTLLRLNIKEAFRAGDILTFFYEIHFQNENRKNPVRCTSKIQMWTPKFVEVLQKGGQNIDPPQHYWLCSRPRMYRFAEDCTSVDIQVLVKAAREGAQKGKDVEFGDATWLQVKT